MQTGPWTDVYSAALLFVEMMTGKQAVDGDSFVEVAFKQLKSEITLPHAWEGRALGTVMHKALSKDIENRYQNAAEFRDVLQKVNSPEDPVTELDKPSVPRRVGLCGVYLPQRQMVAVQNVETVLKPSPRNQPVLLICVICALLLLVLVIFGFILSH
ncbi:MAG: hypothetical protein IJU23_06065 [Proteobacteria bacterium]|nr:hypothetical protein [Pseudomonadota bacterium]